MNDLHIISQTLFEPSDIIELRCIRGKAPDVQIKKLWTTAAAVPSMLGELHELNMQGYNIYFGPNPRIESGKSKDENVKLARCLFCDFDNVAPGDGCGRLEFIWNDIFLRGLPEPTLAVHSGHGLHTYWRLDEPIELPRWRAMQEKLNDKLDADPAIKNYERIMRLPPFVNTKRVPYQDCFVCWSPNYASR